MKKVFLFFALLIMSALYLNAQPEYCSVAENNCKSLLLKGRVRHVTYVRHENWYDSVNLDFSAQGRLIRAEYLNNDPDFQITLYDQKGNLTDAIIEVWYDGESGGYSLFGYRYKYDEKGRIKEFYEYKFPYVGQDGYYRVDDYDMFKEKLVSTPIKDLGNMLKKIPAGLVYSFKYLGNRLEVRAANGKVVASQTFDSKGRLISAQRDRNNDDRFCMLENPFKIGFMDLPEAADGFEREWGPRGVTTERVFKLDSRGGKKYADYVEYSYNGDSVVVKSYEVWDGSIREGNVRTCKADNNVQFHPNHDRSHKIWFDGSDGKSEILKTDSQGNWTRRKVKDSSGDDMIEERVITYY